MDMIATVNGDRLTVLFEGHEISAEMIEGLSRAAFTYSPNLTVTSSMLHQSSDHLPFIWAGRPAVLTVEGNGTKPNDNIHTANDTLNHINYDLMMAILRMNTAFIAESIA
jgi:hypothetical protein